MTKGKATEDETNSKTKLESAEAALATINAKVALADAVVADLDKRIQRVVDEIANLTGLVSVDGKTGTLVDAKTKRTAVYDAYVDGTKGTFTLAKKAYTDE